MGTWEHERGARRNVSDVIEGSAISWTSLVIVAIVSTLAKQKILPTYQDMPTLAISHSQSCLSISDKQGVDLRQRAVRDVDHERRPLLHRLHPPPPRHRRRQVRERESSIRYARDRI